jgi:hypothetical protein
VSRASVLVSLIPTSSKSSSLSSELSLALVVVVVIRFGGGASETRLTQDGRVVVMDLDVEVTVD